jgi:hypothetical protein
VALEPREDGALHRHADRNPEADVSTASSFEAFRALGPGNTIYLRICSAKVMVHVSPASNRLHLTIRLRKELPKGRTVADYIPLFSVDSKQAELQFKAPKDLHPEITLEVPESTAFKFGLGSGSIEFDRIPGNLNIGIGKGDLLLHANGNADYSSINAGFGIGGMRDKRPGGHNVGYLAGGWKDQGSGKYNVELGAGWGDLILLPSP